MKSSLKKNFLKDIHKTIIHKTIIYNKNYLSGKDRKQILKKYPKIVFLKDTSEKIYLVDRAMIMTDRVSVLGKFKENTKSILLANNKHEIKQKFPKLSSGKVIVKPQYGRDSLGVSVVSSFVTKKGDIVEPFNNGDEVAISVFERKGDIIAIGAIVTYDDEFCTKEIKKADMEKYKKYEGILLETAKEVYQDLDFGRMVRIDFKGDALIDINPFGTIGKGGWLYNVFRVNSMTYKQFLKIALAKDSK